MRTLLLRAAQVFGGLVVGLLITEGVFAFRDDRAFPHVNFYVEDADLGVRLAPNHSMRIAFGGNPTTTIATNSRGMRTPEWPGGNGGILVVGDSQVFGLGVEEDQTTPARLAAHVDVPVLNGGVPTYGPDEYLAVVEEVASSRQLDAVVVVFNFSNDLFEIDLPNRDRHTVWDGWAVRTETAPESVVWFPGRSGLYGRSHAFFALRKWMHTPTEREQLGLPSEGGVKEVLVAARQASDTRAQREKDLKDAQKPEVEAYLAALDELGNQADLVELFLELEVGWKDNEDLILRAATEGSSVGDIVGTQYSESTRRITVTADLLQQGAQMRQQIRSKLYRYLRENPDGYRSDDLRKALNVQSTIDPSLATDSAEVPWVSPLDGKLDQLQKLAETYGFTPVVVALPLDVQVLPSQFAKYDSEPRDMTASRVLLDDLAAAARRRGIRVAEPLEALRDAGDEAFLDRDLHLSARGHEVVSTVLAETLAGPAPVPPPSLRIPADRSRVPWPAEWQAVREIRVTHSTRNRCQTRQVREWFRMDCDAEGDLVGMRIVQAPLETHAWYASERAGLVAPMIPERDVLVDVIWADRTRRLVLLWEDEGWHRAFEPAELTEPQHGTEFEGPNTLRLPMADPTSNTEATWIGSGADCPLDAFVPCATGQRSVFPECPDGYANAGSAGHCFALCDDATPCTKGACTPWNGSAVCL